AVAVAAAGAAPLSDPSSLSPLPRQASTPSPTRAAAARPPAAVSRRPPPPRRPPRGIGGGAAGGAASSGRRTGSVKVEGAGEGVDGVSAPSPRTSAVLMRWDPPCAARAQG